MKQFLKDHKVVFTPPPSGAKRATGMVEKSNDLLEMILKKQSKKKSWPLLLNRGVYELNRREIKHFGFSAYQILFGFQPPSNLELKFPSLNRSKYLSEMVKLDWHQLQVPEKIEKQKDAVIHHVANLEALRLDIERKDDWRRQVQKERHDIGIARETTFIPGSLVMLYDHAKAKMKLHASYRGPFVVVGFAGSHKKSYVLRQVSGQEIKYSYHGDQLKPFRLREGYLITGTEQRILSYQNLRAGKLNNDVPRQTTYFEGAWTRKK
ncbi:hypothetical protein K3495_g15545 [Podosphaera aphanis]|nr:hypothetical protein K3495_g15545 [Podosphaera aphanis]